MLLVASNTHNQCKQQVVFVKLYFGDILVGYISSESGDFPGFSGLFSTARDIPQDVERYIEFSIQFAPQIEQDVFTEEYYQKEAEFSDLINSNDWNIKSDKGETSYILVPLFGSSNEASWRLNTWR